MTESSSRKRQMRLQKEIILALNLRGNILNVTFPFFKSACSLFLPDLTPFSLLSYWAGSSQGIFDCVLYPMEGIRLSLCRIRALCSSLWEKKVGTTLSRIGYTHPESRGLVNPNWSKNFRSYNYVANIPPHPHLHPSSRKRIFGLKSAVFLMGDQKWVQFSLWPGYPVNHLYNMRSIEHVSI